MSSTLKIKELKDTIQDSNVNFLIGSGMSAPYLKTLGNIEQLLTQIDAKINIEHDKKIIIRASLYSEYFDGVIAKNLDILQNQNNDTDKVLANYTSFIEKLNSIILNRKSSILSKQINIFTTNIDLFFEKALENLSVEYNDGFSGRFKPRFDLSNATFKE